MDVVKATKELTALTPEIDCDGLTTCHVCSIYHSLVILVKRGRLGGISEMPLLPLRGLSVSGDVCMYVFTIIGNICNLFAVPANNRYRNYFVTDPFDGFTSIVFGS
jgi:hypothetical protein